MSSIQSPLERCLEKGAQALDLRECLSVLLQSRPEKRFPLRHSTALLGTVSSGLVTEEEQERALFTLLEASALEATPFCFLRGMPGLPPLAQAKLLAAFELARRYLAYRHRELRPRGAFHAVPSHALQTEACLKIPHSLRSDAREWLGFLPFYRSGKLGEICVVERGVRTHVNVDPGELFARILALRPVAIFLFHNHPSGDLMPSPQDFDLTRRVARIAAPLGIRLLGHAIVTLEGEEWISQN